MFASLALVYVLPVVFSILRPHSLTGAASECPSWSANLRNFTSNQSIFCGSTLPPSPPERGRNGHLCSSGEDGTHRKKVKSRTTLVCVISVIFVCFRMLVLGSPPPPIGNTAHYPPPLVAYYLAFHFPRHRLLSLTPPLNLYNAFDIFSHPSAPI